MCWLCILTSLYLMYVCLNVKKNKNQLSAECADVQSRCFSKVGSRLQFKIKRSEHVSWLFCTSLTNGWISNLLTKEVQHNKQMSREDVEQDRCKVKVTLQSQTYSDCVVRLISFRDFEMNCYTFSWCADVQRHH